MSIASALLPEFDHETAVTRTLLERVPDDKADWAPHPKSMTLGRLAIHIASIPNWVVPTLRDSAMDLAPPGQPPYQPPSWQSTAHALETFAGSIAKARAAIAAASDLEMAQPWTLKKGGETMFTMPRAAVLRSFVFNHSVHHRAQLGVYLRLLDIPVPSMYGPTADTVLDGARAPHARARQPS
jgi:uncharacterized damage-inducible protein DinB